MPEKIGITEILFVVAIALLLFGPSKFAALGKSLGEGIRNFRSSVKETDPSKEEEKKWVEMMEWYTSTGYTWIRIAFIAICLGGAAIIGSLFL